MYVDNIHLSDAKAWIGTVIIEVHQADATNKIKPTSTLGSIVKDLKELETNSVQ